MWPWRSSTIRSNAACHRYAEEGWRQLLAMRCAGYNNVDFKSAFGKLHVVRVPAYSPYAVAEHAMALLLDAGQTDPACVCPHTRIQFQPERADRVRSARQDRRRDRYGKDRSDIHRYLQGVRDAGRGIRSISGEGSGRGISERRRTLHPKRYHFPPLPADAETKHIINHRTLALMKPNVYIINTSRGALVESEALLEAIKARKVGGAGLDVYEEEADLFYEDQSATIIQDDVLALLIAMPNVIVTSHQAFLTDEALHNIAQTTVENIRQYFGGEVMPNEICYQCLESGTCPKDHKKRCF